ncbi:unnamed protein product [Bursaphelenchus xylophilus]|uniref:guanylate cyclase n=1 Tax=Bursaphelenchus xylophilus TaxID=6326 RepID=A0A1I7RXX6_BURXY|nr:unnamed protein product [Bursaphelenchus xylophilus]CAG9125235.1 unnamed protein product [Bursaphelenchus xylophilus]
MPIAQCTFLSKVAAAQLRKAYVASQRYFKCTVQNQKKYGYIHDVMKSMILESHGEEFWISVLEDSTKDPNTEYSSNKHYDDMDTFSLFASISKLTRIPKEEVLENFGRHFCQYVIENGYDELLRSLSPDLRGFLNNMDSLHYFIDHVVYKANMKGPSFRCEPGDGSHITLHYLSSRNGLYPIVKGLLRELAKRIFDMEIDINIAGRTQKVVQYSSGERTEEHVIFNIVTKQESEKTRSATASPAIQLDNTVDWQLMVSPDDFVDMMPYHFVVDRDCKLVQVGSRLCEHISEDLLVVGTPISRIFEIHRPQITLEYENICNFINGVFILQSRSIPLMVQKQQNPAPGSLPNSRASGHSNTGAAEEGGVINAQHLKLKGQMMLIDNDNIIYLCSPYVRTLNELDNFGLKLSSFSVHDSTRDLILLNQQRTSDVEGLAKLERLNQEIEEVEAELGEKEEFLDALRHETFPGKIAQQMSQGNEITTQVFDLVTVMYVDVPTFQLLLRQYSAAEVVGMIEELFDRFDRLVHMNDVYKISGIGETYVCVAGVPEPTIDHAETMIHIALGMEWKARMVVDPKKKESMLVRCGIHTGSVIAGVVGEKTMRYAVYGECMNVAMKIPQDSAPGRIVITETTRQSAQTTGRFDFEPRGMTAIPDHDNMETFYVKKSYKKSVFEIINRARDENIDSIDGYAELEKILQGVGDKVILKQQSSACRIL